jgi:chromate transporter
LAKLGFISFGESAGQIAIMHHDLVEEKRWDLGKAFFARTELLHDPAGPEAQQLAPISAGYCIATGVAS